MTASPPRIWGPQPNLFKSPPHLRGNSFPMGGCSGPQPPTGLAGVGAMGLTAQALVKRKALSGESSLQGSRKRRGRGTVD